MEKGLKWLRRGNNRPALLLFPVPAATPVLSCRGPGHVFLAISRVTTRSLLLT
jgi:hypothetical protein